MLMLLAIIFMVPMHFIGAITQKPPLYFLPSKSSQAWVAETATYMLFRVALNESSTNASDKYGMFETKNINQDAARQALDYSRAYLVAYPQGIYAESIQGLERRIYWYL